MTEDEARGELILRGVSRETFSRIDRLLAFLVAQSETQNLIAASTFETIWTRHVVDSAQLLDHVETWRTWVDLGSGAGFPGLIIAILTGQPVTLVEARTRRIAFLREAADLCGVAKNVEVFAGKVENMPSSKFDVISARAFAPLNKLLGIAYPLSDRSTRWVLPKGKSAARELEEARTSWQGLFELVPSLTDPEAAIIVATGVTPGKHR